MNNSTVAHNFTYGDNGTGSNFRSSNGTLYSYSSVLAIRKEGYILISDRIANYSSSSQRHSLHLERAIGWGTYARNNVMYIYSYDIDLQWLTNGINSDKKSDIEKEVNVELEIINGLLLKQKRARKVNYFDSINSYLENIERLINVFGIDKRSKAYKNYVILRDSDLEANYTELIKDYEKEKERQRKKEIEKRYQKKLEAIQKLTGHNMKEYTKKEITTYDFLYIDNESLCTTQRLCVNLKEALILYKMLLAGKDIIGKKIHYYTILSHNETFIKIGCHNILIKELERVLGGEL